jgi:3-isopropylmalate/(R)-2-methylmalate dehydratase small subunit
MSRVWKFQDNVNTDQIIPGRYYPREDVESLGDFCLCELNPSFAKGRKPGDVVVAGKNFGCGSSREYAALALKHSKIKCIIAKSFARIFYRNCINTGLPILICDSVFEAVKDGDEIEVDVGSGKISVNGRIFHARPLPDFILRIVKEGGIINLIKKHGIEVLG